MVVSAYENENYIQTMTLKQLPDQSHKVFEYIVQKMIMIMTMTANACEFVRARQNDEKTTNSASVWAKN